MSRPRCLFLVAAAAIVFTDCSTTQSYPDNWASPLQVRDGECADIAGTFSNRCSVEERTDNDCLRVGGLAALLLGRYWGTYHPTLESANRVSITQPSPLLLHVEVWDGANLVTAEEVRVAPDDCTEDGILIRSGGGGTQIEGGIGHGSSGAVLAKTEDGNLVARVHVKFTGMAYFLPVSGSSQSWERFEALSVDGEEP